MSFLRRILVGLTLTALTIGMVAVALFQVLGAIRAAMDGDGAPGMAREVVRSVNVVPYEPGRHEPVLTAYGEVLSRRTLEVRATAAGTVVELAPAFEDGGQVAEGQLLVRVDPVPARADLEVARADLAEAEADLKDAERSLDLAHEDLAAAEEQYELRQTALDRQRDLV